MAPTDTFWHFWVSFSIAFFRPGLSFIAGLAKEAYDLLSGDPLDTGDFTANGLGILFGVLFSPFS